MKKLYMVKWGLLVMLFGVLIGQVKAAENSTTTDPETGVVTYVYNIGNNIDVKNKDVLVINGNLLTYGNISISNGGALIVFGNLVSYGNKIESNGKIIVQGDLISTSPTATIQNNGDLVVGGNVNVSSLTTQGKNDLKIFILNPEAEIIGVPGGTSYGDYTDIPNDLKNSNIDGINIGDIIDDVIMPAAIGYQWIGNNGSSNWDNPANWTGNRLPSSTSNVRIKTSNDNPLIIFNNGLIEVNNLTIEAGALLTLMPGAKLTVYGILTIQEEGDLVMENTTKVNGLASLITKGDVVGNTRISVVFPRDKWYYVSQPIKEAKSDIYALLDVDDKFRTSEAWVNIHRANRWYRIASGVDIAQLEGLSVKYKLTEEDVDHVVAYSGELNNGPISRNFANNQYYLFGNPYPSAINWQAENGWIRNNISGTIYYRARVNGVMTFVTYNRSVDNEFARASVFPDGVDYGNVAELGSIPPLQSVWISSLGGGSITIDNDARQHVAAGSLLKSSSGGGHSSVIRIVASSESGADGAVLYFSDNSEVELDRGDSEKMFNDSEGIPEVFTRVGERAMAINGLPFIQESSRIIPISVRNRVKGDVVLSFNMSAYAGAHTPYLEDRETGAFVNLLQEQAYTYTVRETGDNHDRFSLHFYKVSTDLVEPKEDEVDAGNAISIKSISAKVLISVGVDMVQGGQGVVEIYTIEGRKLSEVPAKSSRTLVFLPAQSGIYIVRAQFGNKVKSERVIVKGN